MTAYSDNTNYLKGDFVHVLVPLGDYNQKKIILRKVQSEEEPEFDIRPFERYAPVTENFNINYDSPLDEHTFIVNKTYKKTLFERQFTNPVKYMGYNRLGVKMAIYANLKTLTQEVVSGKYSIKVYISGIDQAQSTEVDFSKTMTIKTDPQSIEMDDMVFINPFITYGYCNQEKVFNIENFAITGIKITIEQSGADTDAFLDTEGNPVSSDSFFIKIKNIHCSLGYECTNDDMEKYKLYAYTLDGLKYSFSTSTIKRVNTRLIYFTRDQHFMPYGVELVNGFSYSGWASYSPESSYVDDVFKLPGYSPILNSSKKEDGIFKLTLNNNKGLQTNKFISSVYYKDNINSNEIEFHNIDYVKNAEILDNVLGFSGRLEDNRENFNIYGLDNRLLNEYNENETYHLILSYNSVNDRKIKEGDTISWTFPSNNTMLIPVVQPVSFEQNENDPNNFYVTVDEYNALYRDGNFRIPFKIKNIYNQNFINNAISCNFTFIDENDYEQTLEFSKTIQFGFSGSEGAGYISDIALKNLKGEKIQSILNTENNFAQYVLSFDLYDYNMKRVDTIKPQYKWLNEKEYFDTIDLNKFKTFDPIDRIIVARYKNQTDNYSMVYLPIGTLYENGDYKLEGCRSITYDQNGTKPFYYKEEYKLHERDVYIGGAKFSLKFPPSAQNLVNERPVLTNKKIKPYSLYVDGLTHFSVLVKTADDINILELPVVIIQNQYSSCIENEKVEISVSEDTMEKILFGYTSTDKDGLVIGKLTSDKNDSQESVIGLYNYIKGKRFFSLDEKNGLIVYGDDNGEYLNIWNGNLHNCYLDNCEGTITNAKKLVDNSNTGLNIGSANQPIYFSNGVPVTCTSVATSQQISDLTNQINQMKQQIENLQNQIKALS